MHIHLVGIGGAGLSAIARLLLGRSFIVSGSDQQSSEFTAALLAEGASLYQGHRAENIAGADALVISSAISAANPEVTAAQAAGIPVFKRADFLGFLMQETINIAVAGSHGKTTTTGMIAQILIEAELDPTFIIGAALPSLGVNGRYGSGDYFVIEADEYDYMFLGLRPEVGIITNIEHDHPDFFPTAADYTASFRAFATSLPDGGRLIISGDDPGAAGLLSGLDLPEVEITTYGIPADTEGPTLFDFQALDCQANDSGGTDFLVEEEEQILGQARLCIPGLHNVRNALAAIIVALDLGIDFPIISHALAGFGGMGRRFQVIGEVNGVTIVDDYAHHPTEIRVTLAAARQRYPGRRLWAVWQPHTYSRTRLLQAAFATSFAAADQVVALDIYASREKDTLGITTADVLARMDRPQATYMATRAEAVAYLLEQVRAGDVIVTFSAGDGNMVSKGVLAGLRKQRRGKK
jgi:UDP-N-acetylmuramate--alanine ligase